MPAFPPDDHTHTEWSWDAPSGSMEGSCARAVELGLPSIAFTEHVDFTRWLLAPEVEGEEEWFDPAWVGPDGRFRPPPLDTAGYLACVQRCREKFPDLRIVSGAELGEPHWHEQQVSAVLGAGGFDRVLGSVHTLAPDEPWMVDDHLYQQLGPAATIRRYLAEALRLASSSAPFAVLAHIDYPLRFWPSGRPVRPGRLRGRVPRCPARAGPVRPGARNQHPGAPARPDRALVAPGRRRNRLVRQRRPPARSRRRGPGRSRRHGRGRRFPPRPPPARLLAPAPTIRLNNVVDEAPTSF